MRSTFTVNQIVYRWHVQYRMLQLWRIVGLRWPWPRIRPLRSVVPRCRCLPTDAHVGCRYDLTAQLLTHIV